MKRAVALLLFVAAACGKQDPQQAREKVESWNATLSLAASHWRAGDLSDHFVVDTCEAAAEELERIDSPDAPRVIDRALALEDEVKRKAP